MEDPEVEQPGRRGPDTPSSDDAFAWAEQLLLERGWPPPVDALAALRDLLGDRGHQVLGELTDLLRRRMAGDYRVDDLGFDEELTTRVLLPLLRPLHRWYWRVSSRGHEHVPPRGPAVLVANHAGTLPFDALMLRLDVFDATGRHARALAGDVVFRAPFLGELARKAGATAATADDAARLLAADELVAVWPEGYAGIGKPWRERYRVGSFGRGGFVTAALRARAPIVPTAVVGSEEIYPLLLDLRPVARWLDLPYFPVVAQLLALPVLGPFALLPLPSKWVIEYGRPVELGFPPEAADDPMTAFDGADRVREEVQELLERAVMGRWSVFL